MSGRPVALFLDLENVIGGYGEGFASRVNKLSLTDLQAQIAAKSEQASGPHAVKRAYADWSKTGLKVLRKTLVEEGIEPRQVFGFGDGGKTNAADIELVIDVLEIAYQRPEVTTFVIVSGDGGFGSLVRKLHEFGKTVVVAAYSDRAGRALRAVCDEFIVLEQPRAPALQPAPTGEAKTTLEILRAIAAKLRVPHSPDIDGMLRLGRDFFLLVLKDDRGTARLVEEGLPVSDLAKALGPALDSGLFKERFKSMTGFLEAVLAGTGLDIERGGPGRPARVTYPGEEPTVQTSEEAPAAAPPTGRLAELASADPRALPQLLGPAIEELLDASAEHSISVPAILGRAGPKLREAAKEYFGSTTSLLRIALRDSRYGVVRSRNDHTRTAVRLRASVDDSVELLADLSPFTEDEYARQFLRRDRIPVPAEPADFVAILQALERAPFVEREPPSQVIARLIENEEIDELIELSTVRQTFSLMRWCGVLQGEGPPSTDWLDEPVEQVVGSAARMEELVREFLVKQLAERGFDAPAVLDRLLPVSAPEDSDADPEPAPAV